MILYRITRPIARIAFQLYFRKIYLLNRELLPKKSPVILAANHPTAFLEPCVLATILPRPLHFLARGDLFNKPFYARMLYSWNLLPIFRFRDGFGKLKQNTDTFEACYKALAEHKVIMIMVEGSTEEVFRLRPLQKGAARLAFGALERHPRLDIHIVPVGVNFTNPNRFRSQAIFSIGQPIPVSEYREDYEENPQLAVRDLTHEIENRLRARMIHIDDPKDEALVIDLMQMYRNSDRRLSLPVLSSDKALLAAHIEIADHVNQMDEEEKEEWQEQIQEYRDVLKKHRLFDLGVAKQSDFQLSNTLILLLGFIPVLIGLIGNYLPIGLARYITRTRVRQREYIASVLIAASIGFYLIYILILLIAGLLIWGWETLLALLVLSLSGYFTILYLDLYRKWNEARKVKALDKELRRELVKKREKLLI